METYRGFVILKVAHKTYRVRRNTNFTFVEWAPAGTVEQCKRAIELYLSRKS